MAAQETPHPPRHQVLLPVTGCGPSPLTTNEQVYRDAPIVFDHGPDKAWQIRLGHRLSGQQGCIIDFIDDGTIGVPRLTDILGNHIHTGRIQGKQLRYPIGQIDIVGVDDLGDLLDDTAPLCRLNWPQWCQYTLAGDALQCQADLGETGEGQFVEGEWLESLPCWLLHFLLV